MESGSARTEEIFWTRRTLRIEPVVAVVRPAAQVPQNVKQIVHMMAQNVTQKTDGHYMIVNLIVALYGKKKPYKEKNNKRK